MTVVISGFGAVTGYGWGAEELCRGVWDGRSAGRMCLVDGRPTLLAAVPEGPCVEGALTRMEAAALWATEEALADAGAAGCKPDERTGVIFCTGVGDLQAMRDEYFSGRTPRPSFLPHMLPTALPSMIAKRYGFRGSNLVVNAACASVNVALLTAREWLWAGRLGSVVIIAAEFCAIRELIEGFRRLQVLVHEGNALEVCQPFDSRSRGFFLGEAAVAFVVSAGSDGTDERPIFLGGASTHEAHHLTAVDVTGRGIAECLRQGLQDARLAPSQVHYINVHGTGTRLNDRAELAGLTQVFSESTSIYATKQLTGHCMSAAAGVELGLAYRSCMTNSVPLPRVLSEPGLTIAPFVRAGPNSVTGCCSVGLGGYNSIVFIRACKATLGRRNDGTRCAI
jgi:3-oxoacyl-[acyl-carrier-protein] synthase II